MSRGYSIARQAFATIERRKRWGQMHTGKVWTLYALDAPALRGWGHGRTLRAAMNDAIGQAARRDTQLRLRDAAYARADGGGYDRQGAALESDIAVQALVRAVTAAWDASE